MPASGEACSVARPPRCSSRSLGSGCLGSVVFLLSKILPLLVLPVGLILLLLLWAALSGRRAPVIAAFALLWIFATPLTAEGLWRW